MRDSVRKSTYDRNESLCRVHLIPALGRMKLKTLSAADVAGSTAPGSTPGVAPRRSARCTRRYIKL
jgi:hypothetical protein